MYYAKARAVLFALLTFVVAAAAFALARPFAARAHAQQVSRTPFTAFMVENQYPAGQLQPDRTEHYLRAVKSDGTEVTIWMRQSPRQEWMQPKVILDLPNGTRISVDPFTESLTTYPLSKDTVAFYQSWPKSECTDQRKLERSNWLGYDVRKVHKDLAGPPGTRSSLELLEAVALGCFALQENWTLGSKEAVEPKIIRQAQFVTMGEPDQALFGVPTSYVERPPSQVFAEYLRRYPESHPLPTGSDQAADEAYEKARH